MSDEIKIDELAARVKEIAVQIGQLPAAAARLEGAPASGLAMFEVSTRSAAGELMDALYRLQDAALDEQLDAMRRAKAR